MGSKIKCEYMYCVQFCSAVIPCIIQLQEACDVFTCELSSDEEDGTYLTKALPPAPGKLLRRM